MNPGMMCNAKNHLAKLVPRWGILSQVLPNSSQSHIYTFSTFLTTGKNWTKNCLLPARVHDDKFPFIYKPKKPSLCVALNFDHHHSIIIFSGPHVKVHVTWLCLKRPGRRFKNWIWLMRRPQKRAGGRLWTWKRKVWEFRSFLGLSQRWHNGQGLGKHVIS